MLRKVIWSLLGVLVFALGCSSDSNETTVFEVTVQNVSSNTPGQPYLVAFSPLVWAVHEAGNPLFTVGAPASSGMELLAEAGDPTGLAQVLPNAENVLIAGAETETVGKQAFLPPGDQYKFQIVGSEGERFSLVSSFIQANDTFAGANGMELFDAAGNPVSGDITANFALYDAGTEVDQPVGAGPDQVARQTAPNSGAAQGAAVQPITTGYPALGSMLRVTITPVDEVEF